MVEGAKNKVVIFLESTPFSKPAFENKMPFKISLPRLMFWLYCPLTALHLWSWPSFQPGRSHTTLLAHCETSMAYLAVINWAGALMLEELISAGFAEKKK